VLSTDTVVHRHWAFQRNEELTVNNTHEIKRPTHMNNQFSAVAGMIRGFIVATFVAIVMFPVVLSVTAAKMI
jgi:hypothetical protein